MRFVLVGQAPAPSTIGKRPLTAGATTRRLHKMMGVTRVEYKELFLRANLFSSYLGPAPGGGDAFPRKEARSSARKLLKKLPPGCAIVALGSGVAGAFGFPGGVGFFRWFEHGGRRCVVSPHPSGKSRWWNVPHNRRKAREFYRRLARDARFGLERSK